MAYETVERFESGIELTTTLPSRAPFRSLVRVNLHFRLNPFGLPRGQTPRPLQFLEPGEEFECHVIVVMFGSHIRSVFLATAPGSGWDTETVERQVGGATHVTLFAANLPEVLVHESPLRFDFSPPPGADALYYRYWARFARGRVDTGLMWRETSSHHISPGTQASRVMECRMLPKTTTARYTIMPRPVNLGNLPRDLPRWMDTWPSAFETRLRSLLSAYRSYVDQHYVDQRDRFPGVFMFVNPVEVVAVAAVTAIWVFVRPADQGTAGRA